MQKLHALSGAVFMLVAGLALAQTLSAMRAPRAALPQATPQAARLAVDSRQIAALFSGAPPQAAKPRATASRLNAKIFGLRAGGAAIIAIDGGKQKTVRQGARLEDGSKIIGIFADRVEIMRHGVREALYMKQADARRAMTRRKMPAPDLLAALDFVPIFAEGAPRGRPSGFVIGDKADAEKIAALGLRHGDLLLEIAGHRMGSFDFLENLPTELAGLAQFEVKIDRDGAPMTLKINATGGNYALAAQ